MRHAYCYPNSYVGGPLDYDVDPPNQQHGIKCMYRPANMQRLNIEGGFLLDPSPGQPAKNYGFRSREDEPYQFFDGICIGIKWG